MMSEEFNCVEMMHEGAERIQHTLAAKTPEEQAAYWRERNAEFRKAWEAARKAKSRAEEAPLVRSKA